MNDCQPQIRLYHYKSYCKYSLLYEAVMGRTKDFNAGKQRNDIASHVVCSKASISRVINAVALRGRETCGKQKKTTHKMTDSFVGLPRSTGFSSVTQLSQSGVVLWGREVSTATIFRRLREMGLPLPQTCNKIPA